MQSGYTENRPKTHWFDPKSIQVIDSLILAEKTIERIYDIEKRDSDRNLNEEQYNYNIKKHDNKPIYMVFATADNTKEGVIELQRKRFILKFK